MSKGFKPEEVEKVATTNFDRYMRKKGRLTPIGSTEDEEGNKVDPEFGYLIVDDPGDEQLVQFANMYIALDSMGIDINKALKKRASKKEFDPYQLKTIAEMFLVEGAKESFESLVLACFPDIKKLHDSELAKYEQEKLTMEDEETAPPFVSPVHDFKPFYKMGLLGGIGSALGATK